VAVTDPYRFTSRFYSEILDPQVAEIQRSLWHDAACQLEPGHYLDVGCGQGDLVALAKQNGWVAMGIDPSQHMVNEGRRRHRGLRLQAAQLRDMPPREWRIVSAFGDVTNHLAMDEGASRALALLASVVAPGGTLIGDAVLSADILCNWPGQVNRYVRQGHYELEVHHTPVSTSPAVGIIEKRWWVGGRRPGNAPDHVEVEMIHGLLPRDVSLALGRHFQSLTITDWDTGSALTNTSTRLRFVASHRLST
jgi:SAM-dependent methyltransferase